MPGRVPQIAGYALICMGLALLAVAGGCGLFASNKIEQEINRELKAAKNLREQGQIDEAILALKGIIETDPTTPQAAEAQLTLGDLYLEKNDLSSAEESYKAFLANYPNHQLAEQAGKKLEYLEALKKIRALRINQGREEP